MIVIVAFAYYDANPGPLTMHLFATLAETELCLCHFSYCRDTLPGFFSGRGRRHARRSVLVNIAMKCCVDTRKDNTHVKHVGDDLIIGNLVHSSRGDQFL